ncbi:YgdI/YgdR family lipoprotein [Roseateles oligotrophus]|uniref:YgdI/YgdR family lipoprotein n=1 Tax=Roseateles oligotrophus TaxID=1769250 RepID=A0ABT2YI56_9BURK|nr:YgdI/YgdR family lipoprotein [Roseateles oligotrophus]MCV2369757.1 YgdI/YgdR family lipoprotein [Roseateles oligotrophus]
MKFGAPICLTLLAALAGCSSTQYIMSTKEGRMIVADGKPDFNEKTGSYEYRDAEGKRMTIMKGEVVQIMER